MTKIYITSSLDREAGMLYAGVHSEDKNWVEGARFNVSEYEVDDTVESIKNAVLDRFPILPERAQHIAEVYKRKGAFFGAI